MNIFIKCNKSYLSPLSSRNFIFLNCPMYCSSNNLEITAFNCGSGNVKYKNICRSHRWSIHIVLRCKKFNRSVLKLFSLIKIISDSLKTQRRIIVVINIVWGMAEVTNPSGSTICKSNKRIYICSAVFTSYNRILPKWNSGHWLIILSD